MKHIYTLLSLVLVAGCATTSGNQIKATSSGTFQQVEVVSVYDGDTFRVNLNCDVALFCQNIPVRVRGIDTPELNSVSEKVRRQANEAKNFTANFLSGRSDVTLYNCGRDKYFRLLCRVKADNKDLTSALLNAGLGLPYEGGEKPNYL
jgi:endonuclease YncB( thermonuclease family)